MERRRGVRKMTDLTDKAINIKGKQYVLVSSRILTFNAEYPNGSIRTELISEPTAEVVVIKATVLPDFQNAKRYYTGYSQAKWGDGYINKTSALENAETSAVGRALAMMGIGVIDSVASVDEINKAESSKGGQQTVDKQDWMNHDPANLACETCGEPANFRSGEKNGRKWSGVFCTTEDRSHTKWDQ